MLSQTKVMYCDVGVHILQRSKILDALHRNFRITLQDRISCTALDRPISFDNVLYFQHASLLAMQSPPYNPLPPKGRSHIDTSVKGEAAVLRPPIWLEKRSRSEGCLLYRPERTRPT